MSPSVAPVPHVGRAYVAHPSFRRSPKCAHEPYSWSAQWLWLGSQPPARGAVTVVAAELRGRNSLG
jgi:hypothetical protein